MFKFAHPEYLYLLLLIPALILLYAYGAWRNHLRKKQWGDAALFRTQTQGFSAQRPLFKFVLLLLALACGVLMLARPQYGTNSTTTENRRGIEVIFALDVSQSMLAQDVTPSRLERSKLFISNLVSRMDNDRVGFNVFAGEAYPILPLTGDLTSANFFLARMKDARSVYNYLAEKGIRVHDCSHEPLCEDCLRITIGSKAENAEILGILRYYNPAE